MNQFVEKLSVFGVWASNNKYLGSVKNAFQQIMPFTIIGSVGTLWVYVICNAQSGLGAFFPAVMALDFLNPAFNALNFCTIGCISVLLTFALGVELGKQNKVDEISSGLVAVAAFFSVVNTSQAVMDLAVALAGGESAALSQLLPEGASVAPVAAVSTSIFGSSGLFTGMIMAILASELLGLFNRVDRLKIKLPESVPPGIAKAFNVLIPACLTLLITSFLGLACNMLTGGLYVNDIIYTLVQTPLQHVAGTYPGGLTLVVIISLFWCVGIHGNNMCDAVVSPLMLSLLLENERMVASGQAAMNILNNGFWSCFVTFAGTGIAGAVTIAVFIAAKSEDLRSIAKLAALPNCFNINEIIVFGIPVVLNPIMCIGFILAPAVSYTLAYVLTAVGFCPVMYINVPWTTPPIIAGFLASGGNIMGGVTQLICLAGAVLVYIPCIKILDHQKSQENADA